MEDKNIRILTYIVLIYKKLKDVKIPTFMYIGFEVGGISEKS